ncbi:conserved hypothetical protein [Beutenbergia cavernae DSM 12333]|uniref:Uncharacterized protein n=1 Tax=Beutenbergia cavernae (strain ATCC BAA-8 / DSM 12333 / CCUG 43141 / JCM 11478 / NBRC 16432 / NCIMB 13614 / HKI 0122) TaxID=471853 RepID=C5BYY6_BEUC1|nr:hypothetical protein [Beutenbergia cavernae]ACQ81101.1 conserved hypothetical protein [Beutenbergia cavernae DSM 12333]
MPRPRWFRLPSTGHLPTLEDVLDGALTVPSTLVRSQVDRLRSRRPDATPADVVAMLERRYLLTVSGMGGAVGATAAAPGLGTGAAIALTAGQVVTFLGASAAFALSVADVHGIAVDDAERRRALLLAALLGPSGTRVVEEEIGVGTALWGRALLTRLPLTTVKSVNATLARKVVRTTTAQVSSVMIGRLAPFGIGAIVGIVGGRALGGGVVQATRDAFGPAPADFVREIGHGPADLPELEPLLIEAVPLALEAGPSAAATPA